MWLGRQNYEGVRNDLCADFLPFMRAAGYALQAVVRFDGMLVTRHGREDDYCRTLKQQGRHGKPGSWLDEADAYWQLEQTREVPPSVGWGRAGGPSGHKRGNQRHTSRGGRAASNDQLVPPHEWVAAAEEGHCGGTEAGVEGDCESGTVGNWPLSPQATDSWESAAGECLERCRQCAKCHVISVSLKYQDCSWYAACGRGGGGGGGGGAKQRPMLTSLSKTPAGFKSAVALLSDPTKRG